MLIQDASSFAQFKGTLTWLIGYFLLSASVLFTDFTLNDGLTNRDAGITDVNSGWPCDHFTGLVRALPQKEQKVIRVAFAIA